MEELRRANERLKQENQELRELLKQVMEKLAAAEQKIERLTEQLAQNSRNSHWPSSRDKSRKKKQTQSLRQKSKRQPGGQKGHRGHTLEFKPEPDEIITHRPEKCGYCQMKYPDEMAAIQIKQRQVIDLPPLQVITTEHRVETIACPHCQQTTTAAFPKEVTNPVQYGPRIKQLAVYLKHQQFIPYERGRQFFQDLFGLQLGGGTLQNFTEYAAIRLQPVTEQIKRAISGHDVAHFDETGFYVGGKRVWCHSSSTETLTYYQPHRRRGTMATNEIGILPEFQGTAVHDNWPAYWQYDHLKHALCNVHHLRELVAIEEHYHQRWATRMKQLLLLAKATVTDAHDSGASALPAKKQQQIVRLYTKLVIAGLCANPPPEGGWPAGKRGRPKKTKPRNLLERFDNRRAAILAFIYDFKVPFDNNLAERDIRMMKVQQKVSGCFRSWDGAEQFCIIRGYISTNRKQGLSVWQALGSIFSGDILLPQLAPG